MAHASMLLAGRYTLDELLGTGGFCEVWRATDTVLGRPVAVKLLYPGMAHQPEARARFKAEARHAGGLSDQHIARVYDYGEPARGQAYLVMELVEGPSLADVLAQGPLDAARTMDLLAQVGSGLRAAHGAGVIHRDIKPANILFACDGTAKITDFGIAHAIGSVPLTASGTVMGTPGYIAPERVSGGQDGAPGDLYALGIVAYECLAGTRPFSGAPLEVAIAHRDRPLPPLPPTVPDEVAAFVMMLAAKDPAWRPANAGEVADQAARLRDGLLTGPGPIRPVPVAPPPVAVDSFRRSAPATHPDRPARPDRGRKLALAGSTLAAVAALSVAGLAWLASGSPPSASHPAAAPSSVSRSPAAGSPAASAPRTRSAPPAAASSSPAAVSQRPGASAPGDDRSASVQVMASASTSAHHGHKGEGNKSGKENGNGNGKGDS
jgi:serine/threonine protein kinase